MIATVLASGVLTPSSPAQNAAASDITGVYNGTYTGGVGRRTLKLALQPSGKGTLTGVFTFYLPPTSHDQAYSFVLTGKFDAASGKFTLEPVRWQTQAPGYSMVGLAGTFDPRTGRVAGNLTAGMRGPFEATRDAAESPTEIATALQSEPAPTAQASTPPPAPTPASAGVQAAHAAASKNAVAVTEPTATTSRITVLICQYGPGGLTGLPVPDRAAASGKAAVSSSTDGDWIARLTQRLKEHAQGRKWDILAPDVSKDRSCAFINVDVPYSNVVAAVASIWKMALELPRPAGLRISSINADPPPSPAMIASAKAEEERVAVAALRAAPPAQLASPGLVRKSKAYWDAYETDLIREVFDGGFGSDVDENLLFQKLFCTYVELFSKNCRDSLPAHHESVTMTQSKVQKDQNGNVTGQEILDSWTVEVDSRFAPYYRRYAESLLSPAQTLGGAIGIKMSGLSPGAAVNEIFAPGRDMIKFFATEKCQSAAMRQLGENLLRGATGQLSLQQAGEKIAGAAAETDKDLPPGRYARFVDGCNGFYRDPANARLAGLHSSAWCQCLGEKYQHQMSRDEEYYYANDYQNRFLNEIAEPKQRTDPNWPRLHPACEGCRQ